MSFYLKYRPQTIEELDLASVRDSLISALSLDTIPHAYLFAGPKGTGKTSAARILAKVINCTDKKKGTLEPCNACESCKQITKGSHVDIIEMDAASNRGIDDIRTLREAVKLAPSSSRYKVYIIDEAHMLTTEAGNALLKTLEEPPEHVVFVLATTNPEKLLPTVRSRTTLIPFKKASVDEIVSSLKKKVKGEKIEIEDKALELIAKASDGAFRDADKILEQISSGKKNVSLEDVKHFVRSSFDPEALISLILKNDAKAAILMVEESIQSGASTITIVDSLIQYCHDVLLSKYEINSQNITDIAENTLHELVSGLVSVKRDTPFASIEQLPLELFISKVCSQKNSPSKGNLNEDIKDQHEVVNEVKANGNAVKNDKSNNETMLRPATDGSNNLDSDLWKEILSSVRTINASTEALLRASRPLEYDGHKLELGVYYSFHKEHLESRMHKSLLEDACKKVLGQDIQIVCSLTDAPKITEPIVADKIEVVAHVIEENMNNSALTEADDKDIMKIAEEIFGD